MGRFYSGISGVLGPTLKAATRPRWAMSTAPETPATPGEASGDLPIEHEQLLRLNVGAIQKLAEKLYGDGRNRDVEKEQLRVRQAHEIGYLSGKCLDIIKDMEDREEAVAILEELKAEFPEAAHDTR